MIVIIGPQSRLRLVPAEMDRRQTLMFEGIRFSIEMADVAHIRLRETLLRLSADQAGAPDEDVPRALEDAWSVVDSAHRLMGVLRQAPGIHHRDRWPSIRQLLIDMAETHQRASERFSTFSTKILGIERIKTGRSSVLSTGSG